MTLESHFPEPAPDRSSIEPSITALGCKNVLRLPEPPSSSASSVRTVAPADRGETLDYIAELTGGLSVMAAAIDNPVLARLLAVAEEEARRSLQV